MKRTQCCENNNLTSDVPVKYGVPQSSTLGPLLFILFINDLTKSRTTPNISLYAEDTAFYLSDKNPIKLSQDLSDAATEFQEWCKLNRLTLNQKKCKSVILLQKTTIKY